MLAHLFDRVGPVDHASAELARRRHARLAKPPGSLGALETLGAQLAAISGQCPPPVPQRPTVIVAAGDHGVHAQGVSDWPQGVTAAMVDTVVAGRAAVSAIARTVGAEVIVVDVGTMADRQTTGDDDGAVTVDAGSRDAGPRPVRLIDARVRRGTRDMSLEAAMTRDECAEAIRVGAHVAEQAIAAGTDLVAVGDLGIGNTTVSACLIAAYTGATPDSVTGPGANLDDQRVGRKIEVVTAALRRHGDDRDPFDTLASLGGLEHATLVGVMAACAAARVPVVLDGVITGAAALAAVALAPDIAGHLVAGHASTEPGAAPALTHLSATPLLRLDLRLGEGTGALLAVPLVQAAARTLGEMAFIDDVV